MQSSSISSEFYAPPWTLELVGNRKGCKINLEINMVNEHLLRPPRPAVEHVILQQPSSHGRDEGGGGMGGTIKSGSNSVPQLPQPVLLQLHHGDSFQRTGRCRGHP